MKPIKTAPMKQLCDDPEYRAENDKLTQYLTERDQLRRQLEDLQREAASKSKDDEFDAIEAALAKRGAHRGPSAEETEARTRLELLLSAIEIQAGRVRAAGSRASLRVCEQATPAYRRMLLDVLRSAVVFAVNNAAAQDLVDGLVSGGFSTGGLRPEPFFHRSFGTLDDVNGQLCTFAKCLVESGHVTLQQLSDAELPQKLIDYVACVTRSA